MFIDAVSHGGAIVPMHQHSQRLMYTLDCPGITLYEGRHGIDYYCSLFEVTYMLFLLVLPGIANYLILLLYIDLVLYFHDT